MWCEWRKDRHNLDIPRRRNCIIFFLMNGNMVDSNAWLFGAWCVLDYKQIQLNAFSSPTTTNNHLLRPLPPLALPHLCNASESVIFFKRIRVWFSICDVIQIKKHKPQFHKMLSNQSHQMQILSHSFFNRFDWKPEMNDIRYVSQHSCQIENRNKHKHLLLVKMLLDLY